MKTPLEPLRHVFVPTDVNALPAHGLLQRRRRYELNDEANENRRMLIDRHETNTVDEMLCEP
jgi:hypothetical protein